MSNGVHHKHIFAFEENIVKRGDAIYNTSSRIIATNAMFTYISIAVQ